MAERTSPPGVTSEPDRARRGTIPLGVADEPRYIRTSDPIGRRGPGSHAIPDISIRTSEHPTMSRTVRHVTLFAITAMGAIVAAGTTALADDLIFADVLNDADPDGNSIRMVSTAGTGLHTLIRTGAGVRGIDVDAASGFIYWTDVDNFVIRRARFDGSMQEDLITTGLAFPSALRLSLGAGRMYWGDQTNEDLWRANINGTAPEPLTPTPFFRGIALDNAAGRVYWSTSVTASTGRIVSANLDGTDLQTVIPIAGSNFKPGNIALDLAAGKIYWTDAVARVLRRANLNGTNTQTLFDGAFVGAPKGLALDLAAGKVYFGVDVRDQDSDGFLYGEIRRTNLDGSNVEIVISGLGSVNDLILSTAQVCFADFNGDGAVSVQDIFDFLAAYFSNDSLADFNHSGSVTVQDIFDYLAAYFEGCQ
jgi:hypothetical protein